MTRRQNKSFSWLDLAGILLSGTSVLTRFTAWIRDLQGISYRTTWQRQQVALNSQRLENLRVDAQLKTQRTAKVSNDVTITDARAELELKERTAKLEAQILKNLELRKKLQGSGILNENFQAVDYRDPGDVRHGVIKE